MFRFKMTFLINSLAAQLNRDLCLPKAPHPTSAGVGWDGQGERPRAQVAGLTGWAHAEGMSCHNTPDIFNSSFQF